MEIIVGTFTGALCWNREKILAAADMIRALPELTDLCEWGREALLPGPIRVDPGPLPTCRTDGSSRIARVPTRLRSEDPCGSSSRADASCWCWSAPLP
jgi:hypothetical protein